MNNLPITITAKDIADLIRYLNSRRNKDRNNLCLLMSLVRKNIREWYKEILSFAPHEMGKHVAEEGKAKTANEIGRMVSVLLSSDRRTAARESVIYLNDIKNRKIKGIEKLDMSRLDEIINLIDGRHDFRPTHVSDSQLEGRIREGFIHLARDDNDAANLRKVVTGWEGKERYTQLLTWLLDLETIKDLIEDNTHDIMLDLNCPQDINIDTLYKEYHNIK